MDIPVVEGQPLRDGVRVIMGALPISILSNKKIIHWRQSLNKEQGRHQGYQRKPSVSRIKKFADEIRKERVDIPTAILLNAEDQSWIDALIETDSGQLIFDTKKYQGRFSVVDGQHRVEALGFLYQESPRTFSDFRLQFVMLLGATKNQELEQFYVVNSTAKSVRTDLALDLLKHRAESDPEFHSLLTLQNLSWKITAQNMAIEMFNRSDVWKDRIRFPNEEKGITILSSSAFAISLKNVLKSPFISPMAFESQFSLLDAYWKGLTVAIPEPFERPSEYALQKGIGVWALHEIFPTVVEHVRNNQDKLFEADSYTKVMKVMFAKLDGQNKNAEIVSGSKFWRTVTKGGAIGTYSSSAGKKVLLSKMLTSLPELKIL